MDGTAVVLIGGVGLVLLSVVTLVSTGSLLAMLVVLTLVAGFIAVMTKLGYIQIDINNGGVSLGFHEIAPPAPATSAQLSPGLSGDLSIKAPEIQKSEVFYVGGNDYAYDEAPAVCAAYGAELATYDQVNQAYSLGAEWCAYGWTQGGMALFPTQDATWQKLQQDAVAKTSCGRPGVNGGYFDPSTKFGVNCYGVKPKDTGTITYPTPLAGTDTATFNSMVAKFKSMIDRIPINPFNRNGWSAWNLSSHGVNAELPAGLTNKS